MQTSRTSRIRKSVSVALIALTLGTGITVSAVETAAAQANAVKMERGLGYVTPRAFVDPPDTAFHRRGIGFLKE